MSFQISLVLLMYLLTFSNSVRRH